MKRLLLFAAASSFLNSVLCAVGKTPLLLEKNLLCQSKELNYWNAIILQDFKAMTPKDAPTTSGMDGPLIIGSDLVIDNYYINSKGSVHCNSHYNESIPLSEYGLYMNKKGDHSTHQHYQIRDAIISGSIRLHGENKVERAGQFNFHDGLVRPMQSCRLLVNSSPHQQETTTISSYENIAKKTSLYLALQKATHTLSKQGQIKSLQSHDDVNDKYYYFNFASCQNNGQCDINTEITHLSDPGVFSQAANTIAWPTDKPIILNIPVARDSTFELAALQVFTSQLPACNTVWNFFTVDDQGILDESAEQSFTVNRMSDNLIGGTFLLPFGNVVDGPSGGFAGQLIASNYKSKGASLYDFEAVDATCHTTSASCWPYFKSNSDVVSTKAEPEQDDLEWMIRRGRQLLPVTMSDQKDQSASMVDEISKAIASTTTVVEILLPSEAVSGSSVSSMLSENSSLLDVLNPQNFFDVDDAAFLDEDKAIVNPAYNEDMEAFLIAHSGQQPGLPVRERPVNFYALHEGPKTTVTSYIGTRTVTHHTMEETSVTKPFTRVKTVFSTTTITSYTGTETFTVALPQKVEAHPTGISFDLVGDRIVTLY
ncbi:hypothetical protein HMPREF1544_07600 [Mucor circinelloides 1006PhL]|uniref:Choice-of-anchor A domain-containing protein n=1 Tax=Mucor circinelloides f. circinelloides (strain 1006PhL) TaxID=1220926 RepID=S2JAY5_MUCC1|nr:hypothetical protein HMPREF1544_07600 [Mucor circinelloides 1006PhL]